MHSRSRRPPAGCAAGPGVRRPECVYIHSLGGTAGASPEEEDVSASGGAVEGAGAARRAVLVAVGAWLVAAVVGGVRGVFSAAGEGPPLGVAAFVLVPIAGFVAAYRGSAPLREALRALPLWAVTLAHAWRLVGLGFVVAAVAGVLPPQFGWPEGLGDVIAAAGAVPLAAALARGRRSAGLGRVFTAWNVLGLVDLVSAITVGILYSPGSLGVLRQGISTAPLTRFPVSLIPSFLVPLFILLHLLGLARRAEASA